MLLLIGGIGTVLGLTTQIFAVLVSILGGAFLIRAFDIDRAWTNWNKPTPGGFIRTFTLVAGIVMILASLTSGLSTAVPGITTKPDSILKLVLIKKQLVSLFLECYHFFGWE